MKSFLVAFLFLVGLVGEASACFPFIRFVDNGTADGQMVVKSGGSCTISFNSDAPLESMRIDQRPKHGALDLGPYGRIRYRAANGYVGSDTFTYTHYGKSTLNKPLTRSVRVAVTVTQ